MDPQKVDPKRKQTQRDLAQIVLDMAGVIFVVIHKDKQVALINPKGCEILGYREDEIVGKNWFDHFLPQKERESVAGIFDRLMKGEVETVEYYENPILTKQGEERIIAWRNTLLKDEKGEAIGTLSSGMDVTEHRTLERKVTLLHDAFQHSTDAFLITDLNGVIIEVNEAFLKTFGYSYEEIIGNETSILRTRHTTGDFYREMWRSINEKGQWKGEIINRRKDGAEIPILLSITPVYENGKKIGYMGVEIDITERKLLEQQVIQSEKMAGLGVIASGIAHEIGNPLTAISSLTQILQKKTDESFLSENLTLIRKHIDRIAKTVRQMVDFAHPPSSQWEEAQINKIVEEAIQLTKFDNRTKEMAIETHLTPILPPICIMRDQILQVCMNILLNGIDAMEGKGIPSSRDRVPTLTVLTRMVEAQGNTPILQIEFKDTGVGMTEEVKKRVFEPFFTTKEVGKGTGLGLSVSYSIIKKHGGRIEVDSTPGKGSTFTVILPVKRNI